MSPAAQPRFSSQGYHLWLTGANSVCLSFSWRNPHKLESAKALFLWLYRFFVSFSGPVNTTWLHNLFCAGGFYVCAGTEIFPPATAAALNPATPPLSTITWIWTEQWTWKKVWRSRWNHFSPIGFTCMLFFFFFFNLLDWTFFFLESLHRKPVSAWVFSRLWFLQFLFPRRSTEKERGGGGNGLAAGRYVGGM